MLEDMECELLFSETRQAHTVGIIMVIIVIYVYRTSRYMGLTLPNISLDDSLAKPDHH